MLYPGQQWVIDFMRDSSDPVYNLLAEKTISLENDPDWKKTNVLIENHVLTEGTHAFTAGFLFFLISPSSYFCMLCVICVMLCVDYLQFTFTSIVYTASFSWYLFIHSYTADHTSRKLAEEFNTHWFRSSETVLSENPFSNWMFRDGSKLETMTNFS